MLHSYYLLRLFFVIGLSTLIKQASAQTLMVRLQEHVDQQAWKQAITHRYPDLAVTPAFAGNHPFTRSFFRIEGTNPRTATDLQKHLRYDSRVKYADVVHTHQLLGGTPAPPFIPSDPLVFQQWYLQRVRLPDLWEFEQGSSEVVVAVIDAGVDQFHPDLKNQWYYNNAERFGLTGVDDDRNGYVDDSLGYDFALRDTRIPDSYYHGTAVSGVLAAEANNNEGIAGAAFGVQLLPLKVVAINPAAGQAELVNLYEAMLYAADQGAKVINVSGGRVGEYARWEQDIIRHLVRERDVVIVAAAGNDTYFNQQKNYFPASYADVLSVTATDQQDYRLDGYVYSPFIDIAAPGTLMETSYNRSFPPNTAYATLEGTSFATPLVAGTAALLRSAYPELSALQVQELLRVTSDPIDDLPPNRAYAERLGKGRLNALEAYVNRDQAIAIRMDSVRLSSPPFTDRTVELALTITNHLRSVTGASVSLSSDSPYVDILDNQVSLGTLATGESSQDGAFSVRFLPTTPPNTDILFRLAFTADDDYTDYQYFYVRQANPDFVHQTFNSLSLTLTNRGRLGFADTARQKGSGLFFNGENLLGESGLLVGLPDGRTFDALMGDTDWMPVAPAPLTFEETPFRTRSTSQFTDAGANAPAGLRVREEVIGRRNSPYANVLALRYDIENTGTTTIDSLWLGMFADWEFGSAESAYWDNAGQFAYATDGQTYVGIKSLETTNAYAGLDADGSNSWRDDFTNAEKQHLLRGGVQTPSLLRKPDIAQALTVKSAALSPGASQEVTFLIAAARSLATLRRNFQDEVAALRGSVAPVPVLNPIRCPQPTATVEVFPEGGTSFRLYTPENLRFPEQAGRSFRIDQKDYGKLFYITCTDSARESDPLPIRFAEKPMEADFTAPDTFDISGGSAVPFTDTSPTEAVAWFWDFGDGQTATRPRPSHRYTAQGTYTVTLTIEDAEGCQTSTQQEVTVVRQGPIPRITNNFSSCSSQPIHLRPENGTHFRFYRSYPSDKLGEGREWWLSDPDIEQVWITNLDSTRESAPTRITIDWNRLFADFSPSPAMDTLISSEIQFTDLSTSEFPITSYHWDFGDGTTSSLQNPLHAYRSQGIYTVRFEVEDNRGCTSVRETRFRVGKRGPVPVVSSPQIVCKDNPATITPEGGSQFRFYADADLSKLLYEGKSYTFTPTNDTPLRLFITNTDSIIESFPARLDLNLRSPQADFDFPRELFLDEQSVVFFQNLSSEARHWHWDFGDGTSSTQRNPSHRYQAEGTYFITLTITTAEGCTASETKRLIAFRRSPKPDISDVWICQGDAAELRPEGGTQFRFFDSPTSAQPVHIGRSYTTPRLQSPQTYYITNTDSTLESLPQRVQVRFSKPVASFLQSRDTLNLFFEDQVQFVSTSQAARNWYWDFGNGEIGLTPSVTMRYQTVGDYPIQLIVRDSLGCLDTARRALTVIDTLIVPDSPIPDGEAYSLQLFPNPTSDEATLQLLLRRAAAIRLRLLDNLGRPIRVPKVNGAVERRHRITLNIADLPVGLYLLEISTPELLIHRKLIRH